MQELEITNMFKAIANPIVAEQDNKLAMHKEWLRTLQREYPSPYVPFKIGVYIRYFNQTKYDNYLDYHKKQFEDTIAMCPNWELVDFYVDEGAKAPNMESSPQWCRLLDDCECGKVNLIITQKVSNISSDMRELALCARILASMNPPIGMYIISEDIYTLASYYQNDLRDTSFLPIKKDDIYVD